MTDNDESAELGVLVSFGVPHEVTVITLPAECARVLVCDGEFISVDLGGVETPLGGAEVGHEYRFATNSAVCDVDVDQFRIKR